MGHLLSRLRYHTCIYGIFPQQWRITHLSFEEDPEPFGRERDSVIKSLAKDAGVEVIVRVAHTLYDVKK